MKKIVDLITISKQGDKEFNELVILAVRNGYQPYDTVQITATQPVYGPDGRFNCGPWTYYTQQFCKYEE